MKKIALLLLVGILTIAQSQAHVGLNYPLGGETFNPGETVNIEWEILVSHNTLNWDLFFSSDGGSTWEIIQADIPLETLTYQWIVPETPTIEGRIKIVMDNEGTDYEASSNNFTISSPTGIGTHHAASEAKVYPNPMTDYTTIAFDNPGQESHTFELYDTQGRLEKSISNITTDKLIVYRENIKSGLYFFQLYSDDKFRSTGKLTIK